MVARVARFRPTKVRVTCQKSELQTQSQSCTRGDPQNLKLRGPAAILFISRDTSSDSISKLFCACFNGGGGAPKERRRGRAKKRLSYRVFLESPFLLSAPLRFSLGLPGVLRENLKGAREETDSPKTPYRKTVSSHDPFAAPLARPDFYGVSHNYRAISCKMGYRIDVLV